MFHFKGGRINSRDVWIYNSQLNIWIRVASLNKGRWRHKMAVLLGKVREVYFNFFIVGMFAVYKETVEKILKYYFVFNIK